MNLPKMYVFGLGEKVWMPFCCLVMDNVERCWTFSLRPFFRHWEKISVAWNTKNISYYINFTQCPKYIFLGMITFYFSRVNIISLASWPEKKKRWKSHLKHEKGIKIITSTWDRSEGTFGITTQPIKSY